MDAREIEKCIDEFGTDIYRFCLKLCMDKSEACLTLPQVSIYTLDWRVTRDLVLYIGLAGVLLTIVGVKRTNMKEGNNNPY